MAKWLENAIFYQIYPQSFKDSNADGIGDIQGIISKLGYIKDTGFNAIWINPCFESPFFDAGYDITDYYKIAPRYGTNEDARELFEKAHELGIHVILDLVPGHTSHLHPWFIKSMEEAENDCSDRYIWTDYCGRDVSSVKGVRGWLRAISDRNGAVALNYKASQPALNFGFAEITDTENDWQQTPDAEGPRKNIEEMKNIMKFWLEMGCDGFRVDMADSLVKNDENKEGTIKVWSEITEYIHQNFPEAMLISEWGEATKSLRAGFDADFLLSYGPSHYMDLFRNPEMLNFDSDSLYFSKSGKGDLTEFKKAYNLFYEQAKKGGMICIPSGNHDMPRISMQMDTEELKLAFVFLMTMPGAPFVYYGDEIGMRFMYELPSKEGAYSHRVGSRTPMQWDDSVNAGFSSAKSDELYLPIDATEGRPTVKNEMSDGDSLYNSVKDIIKFRKAHTCLANTTRFEFAEVSDKPYPLAYTREDESEKLVVIINPSGSVADANVSGIKDILFEVGGKCEINKESIVMSPCSAIIVRL